MSNGVCFEDIINRCSFIDGTKGLVSRGWVVFNGLIRDQANLCKIKDLQQHYRLAYPEVTKLHELTFKKWKTLLKRKKYIGG